MNYQYIEQLIERYFNCQTTLQEEQILRSFFAQEDVPGQLMPYAELFQYEMEAKAEELGAAFDQKMLAIIQGEERESADFQRGTTILSLNPTDKSSTLQSPPPSRSRLTPFFRAAAIVAIVLTVGRAADHALSDQSQEGTESGVVIDPYIRQADVYSAVRVKDMSQAEAKPQADSLIVQPLDEKLQ